VSGVCLTSSAHRTLQCHESKSRKEKFEDVIDASPSDSPEVQTNSFYDLSLVGLFSSPPRDGFGQKLQSRFKPLNREANQTSRHTRKTAIGSFCIRSQTGRSQELFMARGQDGSR
jgi:hypothetical protein